MTNSEEDLERILRDYRRYEAEREAKRLEARLNVRGCYRPRESRNRAIAEAALVREPIGDAGAELWITYTSMREESLRIRADRKLAEQLPIFLETCDPDALNGYVAFPKRRTPRLPRTMDGLVQYIPVHGGVTYASKDSYMAVWGFDTLHDRSEKEPRTDQDWIRANCWILYRGLLLAEKLWPEFRRAQHGRRAELAQQILDLMPETPLLDRLGFNARLGLLAGKVG